MSRMLSLLFVLIAATSPFPAVAEMGSVALSLEVSEGNPRNTEGDFAVLRDGSVLMFIRTGAGEQYRSLSHDRGETWTQPEPMGVASPQSPASIEPIPGSDALVMVWNDHSELPLAERKARTPLSLAISVDDGATWSPPRILEGDPNGWYCYTAMEFVDDALLLAYVAGEQTPGRRLSTSRIRRIPLAELR